MASHSLTIVVTPHDRGPMTNEAWRQALMILTAVLSHATATHGHDPFEALDASTGDTRTYDMSWSTNQ